MTLPLRSNGALPRLPPRHSQDLYVSTASLCALPFCFSELAGSGLAAKILSDMNGSPKGPKTRTSIVIKITTESAGCASVVKTQNVFQKNPPSHNLTSRGATLECSTLSQGSRCRGVRSCLLVLQCAFYAKRILPAFRLPLAARCATSTISAINS